MADVIVIDHVEHRMGKAARRLESAGLRASAHPVGDNLMKRQMGRTVGVLLLSGIVIATSDTMLHGQAQSGGSSAEHSTDSDVNILRTGTREERIAVMVRMREKGAEHLTAREWDNIAHEVNRLLFCDQWPQPSAEAQASQHCEYFPRGREEEEYSRLLEDVFSEARDPQYIPQLIQLAGGISTAGTSLMRFGDVAVPALIDSVSSQRHSPWVWERGGAINVLTRMLLEPVADPVIPLTIDGRNKIVNAARTLLASNLTLSDTISVCGLAAATRDTQMRAELDRLATDPAEWERRGITDPKRIQQLQNQVVAQIRFRSGNVATQKQ